MLLLSSCLPFLFFFLSFFPSDVFPYWTYTFGRLYYLTVYLLDAWYYLILYLLDAWLLFGCISSGCFTLFYCIYTGCFILSGCISSGCFVLVGCISTEWPPLWSSGQNSRGPEVRVLFPSLPDFLGSSGSGTVSTQPRKYNWGATWKEK
jgi:hypothetical protein